MNLPVQLTKNPLVSVVFEIRFDSTVPMSSVLPGYFYSKFEHTNISKTPHAEIPDIIRQNDPQFAYVPMVNMSWGNYNVGIGDKVLMLTCMMPYPGWIEFSKKINELITYFIRSDFNVRVERFSLKYVDLIKYNSGDDVSKLLNFNVLLKDETIDLKYTQFRTEKHDEKTVTIIQFLGQAEAVLSSGITEFGLLIDIDSIRPINNLSLVDLKKTFNEELDSLHLQTKIKFFNFLSDEGLEYLGAQYE